MGKRRRIAPPPIKPGTTVDELVDRFFLGYNAARLREACQLCAEKILRPEVTVGVTLTGALTPAGLGCSSLIPLVEAGFIDWIVSTGANLYHDMHFGLNYELRQSTPFADDIRLREEGIVRIYDIVMDSDVLFDTDQWLWMVLDQPEFQRRMGTAELHWLLGKYLDERERVLGLPKRSLLAACHRADVPCYTSSPGDSTIGLNAAGLQLRPGGSEFDFEATHDVNESAAIIWEAKRRRGKSAVIVFGGGSPKNFILQTEPHIQEILGLKEAGHDFFIQFTDARPDTGGLSGATPGEAVTWGKIAPDLLPDTVVCYTDSTIAMPILASYVLTKCEPRPLRRLASRRAELLETMRRDHRKLLKKKPRRTDWPEGKPEIPVGGFRNKRKRG
jgi:deoxyhypusine synthase